MTASTLADRLGVTRGYIAQVESGKSLPPAWMCKRMERILRLPSGTLTHKLVTYNRIIKESVPIMRKLALLGISLKEIPY